jgi:hypothetical protein
MFLPISIGVRPSTISLYFAAAAWLSRLIFSLSIVRTVLSHCSRKKRERGLEEGWVDGWRGVEG